MYIDLGSFARKAGETLIEVGKGAGKVAKVAYEKGSEQIKKSNEIADKAYEEAERLSDFKLVWNYKNCTSISERRGYHKAIRDRGLMYKDEKGVWCATDELKQIYSKVTGEKYI